MQEGWGSEDRWVRAQASDKDRSFTPSSLSRDMPARWQGPRLEAGLPAHTRGQGRPRPARPAQLLSGRGPQGLNHDQRPPRGDTVAPPPPSPPRRRSQDAPLTSQMRKTLAPT